jgi:hypothetical protein
MVNEFILIDTYVSCKVIRSKDKGFRYKEGIVGQLPCCSKKKKI